jgi:hypothetical protein
MVEERYAAEVARVLESHHAKLMRHVVRKDVINRLRGAADE